MPIGLLTLAALGKWQAPEAQTRETATDPQPERSTPERQSQAAKLKIPKGFRATLFADDQQVHNAYCLGPHPGGGIAVSGPGYIRILADGDQNGHAESATTFSNGPQTGAQGLCFDGNDLLAVGDGGLLRFRDANQDLRADGPPTTLMPLKTGGEHHAHAIRQGPDGAWYLMCGNMTFDEPPPVTDPESPVTEPRAGMLLRFRFSPNSNDIENLRIVADGMRNAYDFDFLRTGDIVTYDSDGEREVSLPWYRPTRVFRLLPGSDAGWFSRSWKWPSDFPEMPETLADLGRGSPTGVLVLHDNRWPEPYANAIFVCDWTFGRVVAIPLDERDQAGEPIVFATATGTAGFAPTDIVRAADGALIVSSGGRGTTGRLYRITPDALADRDTPEETVADRAGTLRQQLAVASPKRLAAVLSEDESLIRRVALEALARRSVSRDDFSRLTAPLRSALSDDNPNVRKAAMHFVAGLSKTEQQRLSRTIDDGEPAARIRFELGRNRDDRSWRPDLLEVALSALEAESLNSAGALDAVRLAQLGLGGAGGGSIKDTFAGYTARVDLPADSARLAEYAERVAAMLPTNDRSVDREIVRLLAMLRSPDSDVRAALLSGITDDSHPTRDLHRLFAIACQRAATSETQSRAVAEALLAIDKKLSDRDLNRDLYWQRRLDDLVSRLSESNPQFFGHLIDSPRFGRVGQIPLLATAPEVIRRRAAEVFLSRPGNPAIEQWTPEFVSLITANSTEAARKALRKAYEQRRLRGAALRGLARQPVDADYAKFVVGLNALDADTVSRSLAALNSLNHKPTESELAALARAVGRLDRNRQEYALRSEVVTRLRRLTERSYGFEVGQVGYRPQRDPVRRWREFARELEPESLQTEDAWTGIQPRLKAAASLAGDVARGGEVYHELACGECHEGGAVGPDLAGVTRRFSRRDLFRSIVQPSRTIPGRYRGELIQTTDGEVVTGLVAYESTDGVTLTDGRQTWRVESDQIAFRRPLETSVMPRGLLQDATPQDLADLEAYLAAQ